MTQACKLPRIFTSHKQRNNHIVVVSGLPRSGTSMLMQMIHHGGMAVLTDEVRQADENNPWGYYEHEAVKSLQQTRDKSWLQAAQGKAIKVISHLLKSLPNTHHYRVILIERKLNAVLQSQNTMLKQLGQNNPLADDKALAFYQKHHINLKVFLAQKNNFEVLNVSYENTLANPKTTAHRINNYLGNTLDEKKMVQAVMLKQ